MIIISIIVFVLVVVVAFFVSRHARQANARLLADHIINGFQTATEERLDTLITILVTTDSYTQKIAEGDYWRVQRLREMRKEMVSPHP